MTEKKEQYCKCCGRTLPLVAFPMRGEGRDSYRSWLCTDCLEKRMKIVTRTLRVLEAEEKRYGKRKLAREDVMMCLEKYSVQDLRELLKYAEVHFKPYDPLKQ